MEFKLSTTVNDQEGQPISAVVESRIGLENAIGAAVRRIFQGIDKELEVGTLGLDQRLIATVRKGPADREVVVTYSKHCKAFK